MAVVEDTAFGDNSLDQPSDYLERWFGLLENVSSASPVSNLPFGLPMQIVATPLNTTVSKNILQIKCL